MKLGQWSRKTRFQSLLLPLPGCVTLDKCLGWVLQEAFQTKGSRCKWIVWKVKETLARVSGRETAEKANNRECMVHQFV